MRHLVRAVRLLALAAVIATVTNQGLAPRARASTAPPAQGNANLANGSKKAILETGLSDAYFDSHFRLVRVIDKPGDRRVIWTFTIGEYATTLTDSLGFYTSGSGERIDTHSVTSGLGRTHDIERVIPRKRAEAILRRCLGRFTSASVAYLAPMPPGPAQLFLTASITKRRAVRRDDDREAERRREAQQKDRSSNVDEIEREGEGGPPILYASVNLETGKCTRGKAIATP